jgi:hypothetical protein
MTAKLIGAVIDALIPLGFAVMILTSPQLLTKKDLKAEENKGLAGKFKLIGWGLVGAGILILIANIGSALAKN